VRALRAGGAMSMELIVASNPLLFCLALFSESQCSAFRRMMANQFLLSPSQALYAGYPANSSRSKGAAER